MRIRSCHCCNLLRNRKIKLRFLELMKMGHLHNEGAGSIFTAHEILEWIAGSGAAHAHCRVRRAQRPGTGKPLPDRFSASSPMKPFPFCADCNRLRLDSTGKIYGCLSNPAGFSIRGANDEQLAILLAKALQQKQALRFAGSTTSMQAIGG